MVQVMRQTARSALFSSSSSFVLPCTEVTVVLCIGSRCTQKSPLDPTLSNAHRPEAVSPVSLSSTSIKPSRKVTQMRPLSITLGLLAIGAYGKTPSGNGLVEVASLPTLRVTCSVR